MRYRGGGKIGGFDDDKPTNQEAVGCWKLGEACQWLSVNRWPRRTISITNMPAYVDTTVGGYGLIDPIITSGYGYGVIQWQYSDDAGSTWTNIPNDGKHSVATDGSGWLTLTGQKRNVDSSGNTINGGLPVDGRLYRVVVTAGLRSQPSDYFDSGAQQWAGRTEIWNDKVSVVFTSGPCLIASEFDECSGTPQTAATVPTNTDFTIKVTATAIGDEHGLTYDVEYSWLSSSDGVNWSPLAADPEDAEGTLTYKQLTPGIAYLRGVATFSYSNPPNYIITGRPDVVALSSIIQVTIT